jgi:hypothetical protein
MAGKPIHRRFIFDIDRALNFVVSITSCWTIVKEFFLAPARMAILTFDLLDRASRPAELKSARFCKGFQERQTVPSSMEMQVLATTNYLLICRGLLAWFRKAHDEFKTRIHRGYPCHFHWRGRAKLAQGRLL